MVIISVSSSNEKAMLTTVDRLRRLLRKAFFRMNPASVMLVTGSRHAVGARKLPERSSARHECPIRAATAGLSLRHYREDPRPAP
jgi:hypothetical protein